MTRLCNSTLRIAQEIRMNSDLLPADHIRQLMRVHTGSVDVDRGLLTAHIIHIIVGH